MSAGMIAPMSALFRRKRPEKPERPPVELPAHLREALDREARDGKAGGALANADASATVYVSGDTVRDSERIHMLVESLQEVGETTNPAELMGKIVDRAVKTVGAERALLFVADDEGRPVLRLGKDDRGNDLPRTTAFSTQVVTSVFEGGEPVCQKTDETGDFDPSQSMLNLSIRAVMCVPLMTRSERLGVLYVDQRANTRSFEKADLRFFQAFADMLAIIWMQRRMMERELEQKRLEQDLELARSIQANLVPERPLQVAGYSMCGRVIPADATGGDYFDFFKTRDNRIAMAVGDVSGHGTGAALVMSAARAYVRAFSQLEESPSVILRRVNRHLAADIADGMFMSMFICILDPQTRKFHYANAGHPGPILLHGATGKTEDFLVTGMALGIEDETDFEERGPYDLSPGDSVLMFSDGVTELRQGDDMFGRQRLIDLLLEHGALDAPMLIEKLFEVSMKWGRMDALHADDVTLAVLRADG